MAALAATLTSFSMERDSKTYTSAGHTARRPRLVVQKRRVPSKEGAVASMETTIIRGTVDEAGLPLSSKVAFGVSIRFPNNIGSSETDLTDALVLLRDVVASDEFAATLTTQGFIKG